MKKVISIILVLISIFSFACASELDDLTFDQLIVYRQYITQEIMKRPEWKEVIVPSGQWIVGVDIPAGYYSISPSGSGGYLDIIDSNGKHIMYGGIRSEEDKIGKIELKTAYLVEVSSGSLIFAPAVGLGF